MGFILGVYRRLISVQIRSQMQYRFPFLVELVATGLITTSGFVTLAFVLQRFGSIAGWKLGEVAFLYGVVETSFGVMDMIFSGFDPGNFGRQTRLGRFDQLLLRPVDITVQVLGSEFLIRRLGRIAQGFVILILALTMVQINWTFGKILFLPVVFLSQIAFFGGLFIIGATISFWTLESIEIVNIFTYGGTEMMSYPMHIYPNWLRDFFSYLLPAIFLNYYPALYFLGKPDPLHFPTIAPFLAPVAGFGVLAIALAFWKYGIRHYQSTGT
jgi:ABC-2 type transport system permease protein